MKLNIKQYYKVSILAIALTLSSCSIDDIEPVNKLTTENTIRDEASAQMVLNGVYSLGKAFDVSFFPLHLAAYGNEGIITGFMSGSTGFNVNDVPVNNTFLSNLYNGQYKIINSANFLIQELEAGKAIGIAEDKKLIMISEAKFQRAFAYFNLVRYFGEFYDLNSDKGVVLRTTFSNEFEAQARNSVKEVYNQIEEDLLFASQNGPIYIDHFYSGSLASKALLAKVYLYEGKYAEASALADEVIFNDEGYVLEAEYSAIFKNSFNSSEVIFAPFTGPDQEGKTNMQQVSRTTYSQTLKSLADAQVGTDNDGSLATTGSGYDPRFQYAYSSATKGSNSNGKYPFLDNLQSQGNTLYHLRLGEIYLIKAEAEARSQSGDLTIALNNLNQIRTRAGVEPKELSDKATLLEDIRQEKLLELFFENGEGWFDIVRYDILGNLEASDIKPTVTSQNQFVLPLPSQVIIGNNALIQNTGY